MRINQTSLKFNNVSFELHLLLNSGPGQVSSTLFLVFNTHPPSTRNFLLGLSQMDLGWVGMTQVSERRLGLGLQGGHQGGLQGGPQGVLQVDLVST